MKKWLTIWAGVLTCASVAVLLAWSTATPRVTYGGRTVKEWSLQLYTLGQQREDAVVALKAMGQKAVPDLVRLLGKSDLPFKSQIRGAVPGMPAIVRPLVLSAYGRPSASEIKIAAARSLGIIGPEAGTASAALESRMRDKDPSVANEAGIALALVSPDCVRQFQSALHDRHPNARRAAAYALGGLGARAGPAVPELIGTLNDPDPMVRVTAEGGLWRIGAAAIPPMLEFIARERGPTRERLAAGLERLYSGPIPPVQIAKLHFDTPELQCARAKALLGIGPVHDDPVISRVLAAMLNDPSPMVRVATIQSLHGVRFPSVVVALIRRLQDEDAGARTEAARALGLLGSVARPALFGLRGLAADDQEPVRVAAAEALAKIEGRYQ